MLLLLHLALNQGMHNTPLLVSLFLAHIGFFLLWQPALNADHPIQLRTLVPVLLIGGLLYFLLGTWFIAGWIILLIGLTSGSALVNGIQRWIYALAAVTLFLELSLVLTPELFSLRVFDNEFMEIISYALFSSCVLITLWPEKKTRTIRIDYLHTILISFGLFSLYTSSILISFSSGIEYLHALLVTFICIGLFLLLLSLLWLPQQRKSSFSQLWEQHILNIGNPFETWVKHTAMLSHNRKITPDLFLESSFQQLLNLSWVCGINWKQGNHQSLYGDRSNHRTRLEEDDITIELYSHIPMGSALKIHAQLLLQLMLYFYNSKLREISLKNQTHMKAVYETGAKLTHDIKNLLQSLQSLTSIVQASDDREASQQLIERQLPVLTQRLQNTLNKLQTRSDSDRHIQSLDNWWKELQSRYRGRDILFEGEVTTDFTVEGDVLDSILENLLENARSKRQSQPSLQIVTRLSQDDTALDIRVCDDGESIPAHRADVLFKQIMPSKDGYGIGLYQSAQLATRNHYALELASNETGRVCFQLTKVTEKISGEDIGN